MKKLLFSLVVLLGIGMVATRADAANPTRGAKTSTAITYSTTISSVSVPGPAVVYSVILSSGASGEYLALFDTASTGVITAPVSSSALKTRVLYSSTSANTVVNFDPPLQFNLGLAAAGSALTGQALIVWEKGRVTNGY
jgi:hypothetical protein